jgi:hypothetical protein
MIDDDARIWRGLRAHLDDLGRLSPSPDLAAVRERADRRDPLGRISLMSATGIAVAVVLTVVVVGQLGRLAPAAVPGATTSQPTPFVSPTPGQSAEVVIDCIGGLAEATCDQVVSSLGDGMNGASHVAIGTDYCAAGPCPPLLGPDLVVGVLLEYIDGRAAQRLLCTSMAGSDSIKCGVFAPTTGRRDIVNESQQDAVVEVQTDMVGGYMAGVRAGEKITVFVAVSQQATEIFLWVLAWPACPGAEFITATTPFTLIIKADSAGTGVTGVVDPRVSGTPRSSASAEPYCPPG